MSVSRGRNEQNEVYNEKKSFKNKGYLTPVTWITLAGIMAKENEGFTEDDYCVTLCDVCVVIRFRETEIRTVLIMGWGKGR